MTSDTQADLLGDLLPLKKSSKADPKGYKIVSIRLRQAEFDTFSEQVQKMGLTHNKALRIAARRIAGFLEIDSESRNYLKDISNNITEYSIDIRNLRKSYEASNVLETEKLTENLASFGQHFVKLDYMLQKILNISQRRLDGQAKLKKAARPGTRSD